MSNKKDKIKVAAEDLREMLEELEPYIRRPVVIKPSTKGRWIRSDGKSAGSIKGRPMPKLAPNS